MECFLHLNQERVALHNNPFSLLPTLLSAFDCLLDHANHLNRFLRPTNHYLLHFVLDFPLRHGLSQASQGNLGGIRRTLIIGPSTMYINYD